MCTVILRHDILDFVCEFEEEGRGGFGMKNNENFGIHFFFVRQNLSNLEEFKIVLEEIFGVNIIL
jgi:hypothetical protein